jgi:hypothetical protein
MSLGSMCQPGHSADLSLAGLIPKSRMGLLTDLRSAGRSAESQMVEVGLGWDDSALLHLVSHGPAG